MRPVVGVNIDELLARSPIKIGGGDKVVVAFFDLLCPFCRKMFIESEEPLIELAKKSVMTLAFCDFPVHLEAYEMHKHLRCLPEEERLKYVEEVYKSGRRDVKPCNADISQCEEVAAKLNIRGVPSTLIYNRRLGRGLLIEGYVPTNVLLDAVLKI